METTLPCIEPAGPDWTGSINNSLDGSEQPDRPPARLPQVCSSDASVAEQQGRGSSGTYCILCLQGTLFRSPNVVSHHQWMPYGKSGELEPLDVEDRPRETTLPGFSRVLTDVNQSLLQTQRLRTFSARSRLSHTLSSALTLVRVLLDPRSQTASVLSTFLFCDVAMLLLLFVTINRFHTPFSTLHVYRLGAGVWSRGLHLVSSLNGSIHSVWFVGLPLATCQP